MLLSFYKCYVADIPNEIYYNCIINLEEGIIDLCDMVYFSDIDINNNIKSNKDQILIYTGKKWIPRKIELIVDDMIIDKINILDNYFNNNIDDFTEEQQETYNETISLLNNYRDFTFQNQATKLYQNIYNYLLNTLRSKLN
jgi:hypothetical protein